MTQWTVIVEFEITDGHAEAFLALMQEHAKRTLQEEPGCLRFDVIQPVERDGSTLPNRFAISELYTDEAALVLHENSPRLATFGTRTAAMVKSRHRILGVDTQPAVAEEGLTPDQLNASNDG